MSPFGVFHNSALLSLAAALLLPAMAADAPALYQKHCAECHNAQRLGGMGPALLPGNLKRLRKKAAVEVISNGRIATQMPGFKQTLTADEIKDPLNLQVRLWNNGTLMQNYNTSDMAHKIPRCIEWVSSIHPLEPGDILALGTNHRGLNPFQDGDLVEIETEPLGRLRIHIRDDLKRTWARETRLQRQEKGLDGHTPQLTGKYAKQ